MITNAKKVLIIDDDDGIRTLVGILIRSKWDSDITEASTLKEADSFLRSQKFDLIFIDHNLPDGIGWEYAKKISDEPDKFGTPKMIGMSGSVKKDTCHSIFDCFIEKPFHIKEFYDDIHKVLPSSQVTANQA